MSMNNLTIVGNVTKDPTIYETTSGKKVTNINAAVQRGYNKDKEKPECDFFKVVCWEKTAEYVCKTVKKGTKICVNGAVSIEVNEKNGKTYSNLVINLPKIEVMTNNSASDNGTQTDQYGTPVMEDGLPW